MLVKVNECDTFFQLLPERIAKNNGRSAYFSRIVVKKAYESKLIMIPPVFCFEALKKRKFKYLTLYIGGLEKSTRFTRNPSQNVEARLGGGYLASFFLIRVD